MGSTILFQITKYNGVVYCLIILQGAAAVPKKALKLFESPSSLSGGGLENLPRADVSRKITLTLLKGFESPDRKVWFLSYKSISSDTAFFFSFFPRYIYEEC